MPRLLRARPARPQPEPIKEVTLIASDASVEFPKTLEAEPLTITLENDGKRKHTAYFARFNEGITLQDLRGIRSDIDFFTALTLSGRMPKANPAKAPR